MREFQSITTSPSLQYLINYSEAKTLFVGPEQLEMVDEPKKLCPNVTKFISFVGSAPGTIPHHDSLAADSTEPDTSVKEDDPFAIFYTSGTTGVPRSALYTHRRKMEDARSFAMGLTAEVGNRQVLCLPLFHVAAMSYSLGFFYAGGLTVILSQRNFDPAAELQAIQDKKATDIDLVPTHLVSILALPNVRQYDLISLKRIWYAASPMPVESHSFDLGSEFKYKIPLSRRRGCLRPCGGRLMKKKPGAECPLRRAHSNSGASTTS